MTTPARRRAPGRVAERVAGRVAVLALASTLAACGASTLAAHRADTSTTTTAATPSAPAPAVPTTPGPWDWPTYGHDAQHTFHGRTTLTSSTVRTLRKAWEFPTGDSVTATPTVVDGVVYVGSWDDTFYAVDLATGKLRWKTRVKDQDGVKPYPGEAHRDLTSDGGLITSSAWFEPAAGARPRSSSSAGATPCTRSTPPTARCTGSTTTRVGPTGPPNPI